MSSEIQRYVLLAGLLVTGYLLLLAWNEDQTRRAAAEAAMRSDPLLAEVPATAPSALPDDDAVPAMPSSGDAADVANANVANANVANAQVPSADDVPTDVAVVAEPPRTAAPGRPVDALVRVNTDVLQLWIDPRGGDIVRVDLPSYPDSIETPDRAFVLLEDRGSDFTYVAQSGLTGPDGVDTSAGRARYSVASSEFTLAESEDSLTVPFKLVTDSGLQVEKTFEVRRGDHEVRVAYRIRNGSAAPARITPYAQIKRSAGPPPGDEGSGLGPRPFVGPALTTPDSRYEKLDFDDIEEAPFEVDVEGGWIAMLQHYFLSAWVPDADATHRYFARRARDGTFLAGFAGPALVVPAGDSDSVRMSFYAGPKIQDRLEEIAPNLNLTVDYGFLWWLADPLFDLLDIFHGLVGNWGFAIILLTLTVKLVLYPLSAAGYRSMANMRKVQPQLKRLQERYGEDRQKLSQEMMNLYRKEKINPLGGCLPMLLQMPVFLSLYWVLYESVELRQAPFVGWIEDMSRMDPFFVLPLLMGATMWIQMKLNPAPPDPMQARVMQIMPIMFTVLFLFFPAGLVLYWLVNSVLSIAQQWYITRSIEQAATAR